MALPAGTPVWFSNAMDGMPVLSGANGSLSGLEVLDAVLLNGVNLKTATALTVASEVATVPFAAAPGYLRHQVLLVGGITGAYAALNGRQRVTAVSGVTVSFAAPGLPDGTATGTITCKTPPPETPWEKVYTGTAKAVYRAAAGNRHFLRCVDGGYSSSSGGGYSRVLGYETMSDVDTGTGPFPTDSQISGGGYWHKAYAGYAPNWFAVADARGLKLFVMPFPSNPQSGVEWLFDELEPLSGVDQHHTILSCNSSITWDAAGAISYRAGGAYAPRSYSGGGSSILLIQNSALRSYTTPAPAGNALLHCPIVLEESATSPRGLVRGARRLLHASASLGFGTILGPDNGLERLYLCTGTPSYPLYCDGLVDLGVW